jgi:hypothetical protein
MQSNHKFKARQLVGRVGLTESDREDLEQEMILTCSQRLPKYNPDRAQAQYLQSPAWWNIRLPPSSRRGRQDYGFTAYALLS